MATASDKFGLFYSECCERFLAPSTSPTFSRGERHPTSIRWASSCGSQAVLMCRMTHGCKCRQADNYELQSCALRPQSGPPPPRKRKKRLCAMRCAPRCRAGGCTKGCLGGAWSCSQRTGHPHQEAGRAPMRQLYRRRRLSRSGARGRPRTTSSRCGGKSRGQGLRLAAHNPGRLGGQSPDTKSHKSPARKS